MMSEPPISSQARIVSSYSERRGKWCMKSSIVVQPLLADSSAPSAEPRYAASSSISGIVGTSSRWIQSIRPMSSPRPLSIVCQRWL